MAGKLPPLCRARARRHGRAPTGSIQVGDRAVKTAAFPIGIDAERVRSSCWPSPTPRKAVRDDAPRAPAGGRRSSASTGSIIPRGIEERFARLSPLPRGASGLAAARASCSRSRRRRASEVDTYEDIRERARRAVGPDQRRVRRRSTGCRSATSTRAIRARPGGLLPRRRRRADHAASRRHEPRRQGISSRRRIPSDPGVLILSRFAGAAHQLTDALLVNPLQPGGNQRRHLPRASTCRSASGRPAGAS